MGSETEFTLIGKFRDDITPGLVRAKTGISEVQAAVISATPVLDRINQSMRDSGKYARESADAWTSGWKTQAQALNDADVSLRNNITTMQAQLSILKDPAYTEQIAHVKALKAEIAELTRVEEHHGKGILANNRARTEAIVLGHEMAMGNYKRMLGSLMVFGEYSDAKWMEKLTEMVTPMNIAIAGAGVAVIGLGAALWKASEAEAEMVHKTDLLGKTLGVSGEAIRGFQYLAVGTGVTTEELGRVFGIFEKNLGKNSEKFRELGITARDPMEAFEQVMDKAKNMGDALQRAAFLNETLGRGWEKTAPALLQGGDAMREAIAAMKIPEETLRNFDRANEAQIQIDKDFKTLSVSSGSFFSGFRANAKEFEQSLLDMLTGADAFQREVDRNAKEKGFDVKMGGPGLSEDAKKAQVDASEAARKQLSKKSVEAAVEDVRHEWEPKINAYKEGNEKWKATHWTIGSDPTGVYQRAHDEYEKIVEAEQMAEDDVRKSWAKKNRGITISGGKSDLYSHRTGPNSVELNDPEQFMSKPSQLHEDQLKIELDRTKAKDELAKKMIAIDKRIASQEEQVAKAHIRLNEAVRKSDEEAAKARIDAYKKIGQAGAQTFDTLAAVMDKAGEKNSAGYKAMFAVAKAFGIAQAGVSMGIDIAKASEAGWPQNIALMAEAAAQGAIIISDIQSISMGHAKGGTQFGGWAPRHESGPEMAHAVVPTQIYQASHTHTTNVGGANVTIHIHGGDQATILRTIRNATTNGKQSSH